MREIRNTILNLVVINMADENEGISEESMNAQRLFHEMRVPHNKSIEKKIPMQQNRKGEVFKHKCDVHHRQDRD